MTAALAVVSVDDLALIVERAVRAALRDMPTASAAPLVSIAEAARQLGVSTRTVRRRAKDGGLASVRVGRSVRIDLRAVAPDPGKVARLAAVAIADARR